MRQISKGHHGISYIRHSFNKTFELLLKILFEISSKKIDSIYRYPLFHHITKTSYEMK